MPKGSSIEPFISDGLWRAFYQQRKQLHLNCISLAARELGLLLTPVRMSRGQNSCDEHDNPGNHVKIMVRPHLEQVYEYRSLFGPISAIRCDIRYGAGTQQDLRFATMGGFFTLSKAWQMKLLAAGVGFSVAQS